MLILCIVLMVLAITSAICACSFSKSEFLPALVMATLLFGVGAGITGTLVAQQQEPQAIDVYRGLTTVAYSLDENGNPCDSIVVWTKDVK